VGFLSAWRPVEVLTQHMSSVQTSVALCAYNGSRYLSEQLKSIASQTVRPCELVVCDDNSSDDSVSIVEDFDRSAPFEVRLIRNRKRLGPAKNFEQAIYHSRGDVICLADQDDIWKRNKLELLAGALVRHPEAVYAFSDADCVDEAGKPLGYSLWKAVGLRDKLKDFFGPRQVSILLKRNLVSGAAMAFRASLRDVLLPIPEGWMHDYWIALLGSVLASGVPVDEVLFDYRRHDCQVVGWRKKTLREVCRESLRTGAQESWEKLRAFRHVRSRVLAMSGPSGPIRDRLALLEDKEAHLLRRARARSTGGLTRVIDVLTEVRTGRYQRFSNSWSSVIRDL
jgi:glycosyltransferase involved in cell wall biosynthesis